MDKINIVDFMAVDIYEDVCKIQTLDKLGKKEWSSTGYQYIRNKNSLAGLSLQNQVLS